MASESVRYEQYSKFRPQFRKVHNHISIPLRQWFNKYRSLE